MGVAGVEQFEEIGTAEMDEVYADAELVKLASTREGSWRDESSVNVYLFCFGSETGKVVTNPLSEK